ncbi:hypothetical protein EVAR_102626_1 [Eumeta japonica]|uniref:Uncharacterized protein n=1 Tax=Eumeta variegata TaxID=151549 RepID=A0A4C1TUT7_EUMVA|nr:hypothetical protein EVAR_102626_1 [Eumeta japonica]
MTILTECWVMPYTSVGDVEEIVMKYRLYQASNPKAAGSTTNETRNEIGTDSRSHLCVVGVFEGRGYLMVGSGGFKEGEGHFVPWKAHGAVCSFIVNASVDEVFGSPHPAPRIPQFRDPQSQKDCGGECLDTEVKTKRLRSVRPSVLPQANASYPLPAHSARR